jgi:hypothetical protein
MDMYSEDFLPNIQYIDRTRVLRKAKEFANQQEDWCDVKKNIYIALMQRLAGMGYISALSLLIDGNYNIFSYISTVIIDKNQSYTQGGMSYEEAHTLIMQSVHFQSINC